MKLLRTVIPIALMCTVPPASASTTYLRATFNSAGDYRGSGPAPAQGGWDPAGMEVGTGEIANTDPSVLQAYVDAAAGLLGSAKGFHFSDTNENSVLLLAFLDPAVSPPTQSSPTWFEYAFRLDPASYPTYADALANFTIYDSADNLIVAVSLGKSSEGKLRYKIYFNGGGVQLGDLDTLTATDQWRVLVKVDPVTHKQTHWVWKNGDTQFGPMLGTPFDLFSNPTGPLRYVNFQTPWTETVDVVFDEIKAVSAGPPASPSALKAVPKATGRIDLAWTDNASNETGFIIERSSTGIGGWSQIDTVSQNVSSYSDTGLATKSKYFYRVSAYNSDGTSPSSNTTWAYTVYVGGPLSDWIDVTAPPADHTCVPLPHLSCVATPNDGQDDTCGIQRALNLINYSCHADDPHVLYFPNGTYTITQTLFLEGQVGPELIGQSMGGVVIQWDTAVGGVGTKDPCTGVVAPKVMFHAKNNYHLVVSNLVFDGARTSQNETYVVGFDLSACKSDDADCGALGNTWYHLTAGKGVIDSGAGIFDSIFRNAWIGLRISHYNFQDSELSVRRSQFLSNEFGTSIEDFNALQLHFWDCKWDNNRARGITNYIKNFGGSDNNWSGDFTVERGRFTNNGHDIYYAPGGQYRVRDSWSRGSGMFIYGHGITSSPVNFTISNNYVDDISPSKILDDYDSMTTPPACRNVVGINLLRGRAIGNLNAGALVMFDNTFDPPNTSDPLYDPAMEPLFATSGNTSAILALSNRYSAAQAYEQSGVSLKLTSINDLASQPALDLTIPELPVAVDVLAGHTVFTVTDADNAPDVINAAVVAAQSSPVAIHFPTNQYLLTSTLTIPAVPNDLVITGSGTSTKLSWYGVGNGPMMRIGGYHTKTTLRDLAFNATNGTARADGLVVEDVNAASTRVFMNRVGTYVPRAITPGAPPTGGVEVDRADLTKLDVFDFQAFGFVGSYPFNEYDDYLFKVTAGPQPQTTKSLWSSSAGGAKWNFVGVNGPQGLKWLIAGGYMEQGKFYLNVSGGGASGNVAVVGGRIAAEHTTETAVVSVDNFPGNVSVVSSSLSDIDPLAFGLPSTLPPTGAIIKQTGSNAVDIESIGNVMTTDPGYAKTSAATFTRASDKIHVCDPAQTYPIPSEPPQEITLDQCYDFFQSPPGSGQYVKGTTHAGETAADMTDLGTFTNPNSLDVQRLYAGLDLFRNTPIPGYYDEPGAQETYQINIDNVKIWEPIYGVRVNGGPLDPSGLAGTPISSTRIDLTWTDNASNEDGFKVRRATSSGGSYSDLLPNPGPGVLGFSDTNAAEGTQYWYRVAAYRTATAESGPSSTGPVATPPNAPTGLTAGAVGSNSVLLAWTDNSTTESGFPVARSTDPPGTYSDVGAAPAKSGTGTTTFTNNTDVLDGTKYWYRVAASKTGGYPNSDYAGPASAITPIKDPTNLSGSANAGRDNRLQWTDNSASETSYEVNRATKSGSTCGTYVAIPSGNASPGTGGTVVYHDSPSANPSNPPIAGQWYCYRIRSFNALNPSASWVGPVSIKTKN